MEPKDYWDQEPPQKEAENNAISEEEKTAIKQEAYIEFMENLQLVADMVQIFPPDWHLNLLLGMMKDI